MYCDVLICNKLEKVARKALQVMVFPYKIRYQSVADLVCWLGARREDGL